MRNSKRNVVFLSIACLFTVLTAGIVTARDASISVTEYGVGTDVVDHQLQGRADSFREGSSVVFWTRLVGGSEGDVITHVWIHEGAEKVSIDLAIGGSHWRTYSRKTLHRGLTGQWTVEARDEGGNLLASATFTCTAAD